MARCDPARHRLAESVAGLLAVPLRQDRAVLAREEDGPPGGLAGAPYLVENNISVENLTEPKLVFEGTARDGAKGFPANVNVAAALSLAGIGPDKTSLQIWADPTVTRNTHTVQVEADAARLTMTIENVPTEENPKTGRITALSVLATLRRMTGPLRVGT